MLVLLVSILCEVWDDYEWELNSSSNTKRLYCTVIYILYWYVHIVLIILKVLLINVALYGVINYIVPVGLASCIIYF